MPHQHEDIFENRKQFQLERMILFSDAVFAIAYSQMARFVFTLIFPAIIILKEFLK